MKSTSDLLYRHVDMAVKVNGEPAILDVACHATYCDGTDVGIVRWQVRSKETDCVLQGGWALVECPWPGYFANAVEYAVALYHDLERKYREGTSM